MAEIGQKSGKHWLPKFMFIYLCELCKMCTREQCICIYLVMIVFVQVGNGSSFPADNVDKDWGNPAEAKIVDSGSFCL